MCVYTVRCSPQLSSWLCLSPHFKVKFPSNTFAWLNPEGIWEVPSSLADSSCSLYAVFSDSENQETNTDMLLTLYSSAVNRVGILTFPVPCALELIFPLPWFRIRAGLTTLEELCLCNVGIELVLCSRSPTHIGIRSSLSPAPLPVMCALPLTPGLRPLLSVEVSLWKLPVCNWLAAFCSPSLQQLNHPRLCQLSERLT